MQVGVRERGGIKGIAMLLCPAFFVLYQGMRRCGAGVECTDALNRDLHGILARMERGVRRILRSR